MFMSRRPSAGNPEYTGRNEEEKLESLNTTHVSFTNEFITLLKTSLNNNYRTKNLPLAFLELNKSIPQSKHGF